MAQEDERSEFAGAAMLARGMVGALGKFTEPVKTYLDEETLNRWLRLCAEHNRASAELLRDLIYLVVHKQTPAEMSAKDTRALLTGEGLNEARRESSR